MSIKVYLHYEITSKPNKTLKLSIPKKWLTTKLVIDVIELFTTSYNEINITNILNKNELYLNDLNNEKIYSDSIIKDVLNDRYDYYIQHGVYLQNPNQLNSGTNDNSSSNSNSNSENMTGTIGSNSSNNNTLRCRNYGCNQFYNENDNTDTSCRHHIAPPIFHDCIKGWSCCKERKAYDWDEFQKIEGCTLGFHSTIDPKVKFAASPTVSAANAAEEKNPTPVAAPPVLKSIDDYNQQNPDAVSAASSALKSLTAPKKSTRNSDGVTAKCQNKGCQKVFHLSDNSANACTFHSGQPIFHDAIKFWSCCPNKKCYDFESFLEVPGCSVGFHDDGVIDTTTGV